MEMLSLSGSWHLGKQAAREWREQQENGTLSFRERLESLERVIGGANSSLPAEARIRALEELLGLTPSSSALPGRLEAIEASAGKYKFS